MAGSLRKRGQIWWARIRKAGQKDRERRLETTSKAVAQKRLAAWSAELEAVRWREPTTRTLHEAIDKFAAEHFERIKPGSAKRYAVSIANLIEHLPNIPLPHIGSAELMAFERARLKQGVATATVRRDLACLSSIYSRAEEWEWLKHNPVKPFLRGRKNAGLTESEPRTRYLSLWEESATLQGVGPKAYDAIVFAIDTGLRKEEQLSLLKTDIDLAGNWINLRAEVTKTGQARQVPLLPRARAIAGRLLKTSKTYLFETTVGERYSPNTPTLWETLKKGAKRAGIRDPIRWHDLRRTCGTRLLQQHEMTIEQVSLWLGHADIRITQSRYAFLNVSTLQLGIKGDNRGDADAMQTSQVH